MGNLLDKAEGLAEIAAVDETTDNTLCQEKHAYRNLVTVDDLGGKTVSCSPREFTLLLVHFFAISINNRLPECGTYIQIEVPIRLFG